MRLTGSWSETETTAFLEEATVPIRIACTTPNGSLWMVSLWYQFADGCFCCATSTGADIVRYLRENPHVAFEVSTNTPPYRGIRGNGTAALSPDTDKAQLRELIERYLGGTDSTLATTLLDPDRDETAITITPDRGYTWDFSARMADITSPAAADQ